MLGAVTREFGPDVTVRQLTTFLMVCTAGESGIDSSTIEKRTQSSQAAVSRNLTKLSAREGNWGVIEFRVDPSDRRRTYAVPSAKGKKLYSELVRQFGPGETAH